MSHALSVAAETALERLGDHDALWYDGTWHRAADLHERACRVAAGLRARGIEPGDRVVVDMANCPEVLVSFQALWRAGAVVTPVLFLLPPPELRHVLVDSGARAVITSPELLDSVRAAAEGLELLTVLAGGDGHQEGVVAFADLEGHEPAPIVDRTDDDLAALLYTGGTTGRAKGVALSHDNLWHCGHVGEQTSRAAGVSRTFAPLPMSHIYGLGLAAAAAHAAEPRPTVVVRWFDATTAPALLAEHRIERASLVPTMIAMLLDQPLEEHDLSSLRVVTSGGAPLSPQLAQNLERRVPSATVVEAYGCTEAGGPIALNTLEARRLGSVGRPVPGLELRILDDSGGEVADGEPGEVAIRAPTVMSGYWNDPEATASAMTADGFLRTGDVGRVNEDGFLWILDRTKDVILRGGFNVYPRDVEDALVEHPAVTGAGVVGSPDDRLGEEVVAFVTLAPDATVDAEQLRAWARDRVGPKACPRRIEIVEELPLTSVMKLDRRALRTWLG